jgi:hypothetical protein
MVKPIDAFPQTPGRPITGLDGRQISAGKRKMALAIGGDKPAPELQEVNAV